MRGVRVWSCRFRDLGQSRALKAFAPSMVGKGSATGKTQPEISERSRVTLRATTRSAALNFPSFKGLNMHACIHVCACVCVYINKYTIYIYIYIYIYTHTCVCVFGMYM